MAIITYKCPNCGGDLKFEPDIGKYKCEFCDSVFTQEELDKIAEVASANEQKVDAAEVKPEEPSEEGENGEVLIYNCPSCGAEIVTDATTAATFCFYCHNPVILTGRLSGDFLPKHIVPFEINKDEAVSRFLKWTSSKKFIPKDFFSKAQIEKLSGVYFPYWIMDEDVEAFASGAAFKVRVFRAGDIETTETSEYRITRKGKIHFEDLSKNALKKADHKLIEGVLPYDTRNMKDFSMGYLSGFQAEKRDIEQEELQQAMDEETRKYAEIVLKDTVSDEYSSVRFNDMKIDPIHADWEYAFLPVWTVTYQNKKDDKIYYYAMNGQNGEVYGELPIDRLRLFLLFLMVAVPVLLIALLGVWFL